MDKNSGLNRAGSKVILWLLVLSMLVFTAVRTLHFLILTFPPDQKYVAYLALAAFDIGVLGWLYFATNAAEGLKQRVVAYGMIFVCAGGVILTTIADMSIVSNKNGLGNQLPSDIATSALWVVMAVIALNVLAGILVHLFDPRHQRHMVIESAKDRIFNATHAAIDLKSQQIAPEIAEAVAAYWQQQVIAELVGHIPGTMTNKNLSLEGPSTTSVVDSTVEKKVLPAELPSTPTSNKNLSLEGPSTSENGVPLDDEGKKNLARVAAMLVASTPIEK